MLPLRFAARWRLGGALMLVVVFLGALLPVWLMPDMNVRSVIAFDKWLHGFAFLVLGIWFSGQYSPHAYWRIVIGLLAFGGLIEVCQYLTVHRTAEFEDLYADAAGLAAGLVIALAGAGGWSLKVERWLLARATR